jgi:HNH endonuclease/Zinc finger, C3HC4 type (RING finger)
MISQIRNVSEAKKKNVAGKQHYKCANRPGIEIKGLANYECPLWKIKGIKQGSFDESGYDIDHIIEHSITGDDSIENLQALCKMCHSTKTKRFLMKNDQSNIPVSSLKLPEDKETFLNNLTIPKIKQLCENFRIVYTQNTRKKDLIDKLNDIPIRGIRDYINCVINKQYIIKCYGSNKEFLQGKISEGKRYHIFYSNDAASTSITDKKYDNFLSKTIFCSYCKSQCICHEYQNEFYKYNKIIKGNDKRGDTSPNSENLVNASFDFVESQQNLMGDFLSNPLPEEKNNNETYTLNLIPKAEISLEKLNNGDILFSKLIENNSEPPVKKLNNDSDILFSELREKLSNTRKIINESCLKNPNNAGLNSAIENIKIENFNNFIGKYKIISPEPIRIRKEPYDTIPITEDIGNAYPNDIFDVYKILDKDWIEILYLNETGYIKINHHGKLLAERFEEKIEIVNKNTNKNNDFDTAKDCCVCLEKINEKYVLIPCGHTSVCLKCLKKIDKKCPICITKFDTFIKIYD